MVDVGDCLLGGVEDPAGFGDIGIRDAQRGPAAASVSRTRRTECTC